MINPISDLIASNVRDYAQPIHQRLHMMALHSKTVSLQRQEEREKELREREFNTVKNQTTVMEIGQRFYDKGVLMKQEKERIAKQKLEDK